MSITAIAVVLDEALAHKVTCPDGTEYRVKKNSETREWECRAYVNGKHHEPWTSYHADDKQDAINTANFNATLPSHATGKAEDKIKEGLSFIDMQTNPVAENVSPLAKGVSKSIKSWGKEIGAPVRVRSMGGKAQFVQAWIPSKAAANGIVHAVGEPLQFQGSIPVEHRQKALKIIYPGHPELHTQGSAGNVDAHSMTMHAHQWQAFFKGTPHEVKGVDEAAEEYPHNFEWHKIPKDAKVYDLGGAFTVHHPDGRKGVAYWGSHDAGKAQATLRHRAAVTKIRDGKVKEAAEIQIGHRVSHKLALGKLFGKGVVQHIQRNFNSREVEKYKVRQDIGGTKYWDAANTMKESEGDVCASLGEALVAAGFDGTARYKTPELVVAGLVTVLAGHGLEFAGAAMKENGGPVTAPLLWTNPHSAEVPHPSSDGKLTITLLKHESGDFAAKVSVSGALVRPAVEEFVNLTKPYAVIGERIYSTHETSLEARAASTKIVESTVVPSIEAIRRSADIAQTSASVKVRESAGFPGSFNWKNITAVDVVEKINGSYAVTRPDGKKGIATWEAIDHYAAVQHLSRLIGSQKSATLAERRMAEEPTVKDHDWKAANGYHVKWTKHAGAGLEIGVSSPEGHHVGGVHGGQLYVKKSKILHREKASKAWQQYRGAHPKHPVGDATFGGVEESIPADVVTIADPQTKRLIEWKVLRADATRVMVEHPDTHTEHTFPHSAVVVETDGQKLSMLTPEARTRVMKNMKPMASPIHSAHIIGGSVHITHKNGRQQTVKHTA